MNKNVELNKKKNAGFTLAEVLVACIIIVLLTAVGARGISTAAHAYFNVIDRANASTLLSTSLSELRNELSVATNVSIDDNSIVYRSGRSGNESKIKNGTDDSGIVVSEFVNNTNYFDRLLVTSQAATEKLHCEYESVSYADGVIIINNISVIKDDKTLVSRPTYMIKAG